MVEGIASKSVRDSGSVQGRQESNVIIGAGGMQIQVANEILASAPAPAATNIMLPQPQGNTESYNAVKENGFIRTSTKPLSTFSIDVDTASYSNVRRFINEGQMPSKGAVRIEELINYFSYAYPQPVGEHPFSVTTELGPCPWLDSHKLVRIGLKAKEIAKKHQ
ncbi:von Willebrand factor type A domain-containing protein, partial [Desulfobulbus sp. F4]|nr:von Willebrand factor type A domain-containing protein [Desulfobulbus sp. F4]